MNSFNVYIDKSYWGWFRSNKTELEFQKEMQEQLTKLQPLNMSEEGVIEYRKRFENSFVYVYRVGEKITHLINGN